MTISERHEFIFKKYFGIDKSKYYQDFDFLNSKFAQECEKIINDSSNIDIEKPKMRKEFPYKGSNHDRWRYVYDNLAFGVIPINLDDSGASLSMPGLYIGDNRDVLEKISSKFFNPINIDSTESYLSPNQIDAIHKLQDDGEDVHIPNYEKGFVIKSLLPENGEGVSLYTVESKDTNRVETHLKITCALALISAQNPATKQVKYLVNTWSNQAAFENIPKFIMDRYVERTSACPINNVLLIAGLRYKKFDPVTMITYDYIDCITPLEIIGVRQS